ncbi:mitofilin family membrane protein [Azospirillum sp.]|uniref:mitofilin family membrane protein n=1 Tax=Azospirillum sp. TaxID=34012 RepID=UPI002D6B28A9|nr:mitofilin family membrane protein [Azospirillum sp.]HYF87158.1 mitofilin family membrane protein [Azospirillum sp.]
MTSRPGSERPGTDRDGDGASTGNAAVDRIVERFGGIRPMAHKLDTPVTTVQGWKKRGAIPLARHADLRTAAAKHRIKLDDADLDAATPSEDRPTDAASAALITPADAVPVVEPVPTASPADTIPADTIPGADTPTPASGLGASGLGTTAGPVTELQSSDALIPPATPIGATDSLSDTPKSETEKAEDAKADPFKSDAAKPDTAADGPKTTASSWTPSGTTGSAGYNRADSEPARPTIAPTPSYIDEPRSGSGFATALSVVALLVGAAALSAPWWGPALPGWPSPAAPAPAQSSAAAPADPALRAQIQQIVDRVGKLEQRPAAAPGNGGNGEAAAGLAALTQRIDALEQRPAAAAPDTGVADAQKALADRLAALEQKVSAAAGNAQAAQELRGEVDSLKQQVTSVNQAVTQRQDAATAAQALVLAAGQLRASLSGGQPFQQDLQAVRALNIADAGVTQPLDAVAPYAAKGIPTRAQLTDRFEPLAGEIVRADIRGEGNGWIDSAVGKLSTLVTVRREGGGVVGTTSDAVVARAEAALSEGNLAKAVEELSTLQGPAAQTAGPWLADAKARLAADQAARQLNDRAIALMTTAAGGKGTAQ